jgi:ferrochelatase
MSFAVLLLAHGTPESLDEMPEYLTRVRGGRPPAPELVEQMRRNYAAIGGRSPLTEITLAQAEALHELLGVPVHVGMRNWRPFVADALAAAQAQGVTELLAVPMAPQYSALSVGKYRAAVEQSCPPGLAVRFVSSWHDHPGLLEAFAEKLREALAAGPCDAVVFTAHSLPERVAREGDPYPREVGATAAGVAVRAGVHEYRLAYQSAGRTPEPWLRPSLQETLAELVSRGARRVVVAPVGFLCDHTEILYDLDVEARGFARERGLELRRTASLNTSPKLIVALADLVRHPRGA